MQYSGALLLVWLAQRMPLVSLVLVQFCEQLVVQFCEQLGEQFCEQLGE
jgi:hypothetical protein